MKKLGKKISAKRQNVEAYTSCPCSCSCDCSQYSVPDYAPAEGTGIAANQFSQTFA